MRPTNSRRLRQKSNPAIRKNRRHLKLEALERRELLATFTWDGGGADSFWTTPANWVGDVAPTGNGSDDLVFTGDVRASNNNSYPVGTPFNSITFNSSGGAANFVLAGNALTLNTGLDVDSAGGNQTINMLLNVPGPTTINVAAGDLTLGGTILGGGTLTKTGNGALSFGGVIAINVTAAGGTLNFASPPVGTGAFSIASAGLGPTGTTAPTTNGAVPNLALGGTAFASDVIVGFPAHNIPNLNDGLYGNGESWIGSFSNTTFAGIDLPGTAVYSVNNIVFGRDNLPGFTDRSDGTYTLYRTLIPDPTHALPITGDATTGWQAMGSVIVAGSAIRKSFTIDQGGAPVGMTGFMMSAPANAAIDEIEIYGTTVALPPPPNVTVTGSVRLNIPSSASIGSLNITGAGAIVDLAGAVSTGSGAFNMTQTSTGPQVPGGTPVPTTNGVFPNLALASFGSSPFASEVIVGFAAHNIPNLNDGLYGNAESWIGSFGNATFAGIDLEGTRAYSVSSFSFGRSNTGDFGDRSDGAYTVYRTLVANPNSTLSITGNANTGWESMGTINVAGNALKKTYALSQGGAAVTMTGLMIGAPTNAAIDEIEIYGEAAAPGPVNLPTTAVNVSASSTLNFGLTNTQAVLGSINVTGAGTTLNLRGPAPNTTGAYNINLVSSGPTGTNAPANLALATQGTAPFASEVIVGFPAHNIPNLNDGLYGNGESWIGSFANPSFAGVDLPGGTIYNVDSIAIGRDNLPPPTGLTDRSDGTYTLYRTIVPNPNHLLAITGDAATGWESMGTITVAANAIRKVYSIAQNGQPVPMTGLMINAPTNAAIDEIEVYGTAAAPGVINMPTTPINISASSTIDFGLPSANHTVGALTITGSAGGTAFNFQSANNVTVANIVGAGAAATTGSIDGSPTLLINGTVNVAAGVGLTIGEKIGGNTTVNKQGAGTLFLTNNGNDYRGETIMAGGILNVSSLSDYGIPSAIGARQFADENLTVTGIGLHFAGGTLQYTGSTPQSTNRNIRVLNGTNGGTIDASGTGAGTLSFTNATNLNLFDNPGTRTINLVGTNTGNNVFGIQVTDQGGNFTSLRKAGTGTWFVTNNNNTYRGETILGGGILNVSSVSDYGVPSAIGARQAADENNSVTGIGLHFQGGTLQYTGATAQNTNRQIRVLNGAGGSTIDASGSVAAATLNFNYNGANINLFDTGGTRTINLVGTNTGTNTFAIQVTDQGTNLTSLRKAGTGTWFVTNNANSYRGETIMAGGILNVSSVSDYGVPSAIGARLATDEGTSNVGLHFVGGTLQYTGSTAQSTNRQIRVFTGAPGGVIDASGNGAAATLRFTYSNANTDLFDTGGTRTIRLTGTNTGNNLFAIQVTDQGTNFTTLEKAGIGTWLVTNNASTYRGETLLSGGILNVSSVANYGSPSAIGARQATDESAPSNIGLHFRGGTLQYTGTTAQSTDRQIRVFTGVGGIIDASGNGAGATLSFTYFGANTDFFDTAGARTIRLTGTNTGNNVFAIQIIDQGTNFTSLQKTGAGTWFVTNNNSNYRGETILGGGILNVSSVANYGVPSAIGARMATDENTSVTGISLHFQGGTLQYTGATPQSTNREIRVLNGATGSTIDASGSGNGTLSFTKSGANINLFDTAGTRTINLVGTNTGNNLFAIQITDQAANATALRKAGTGAWSITAASTYTGGTTIAGGALRINNATGSATGTGAVIVQNTGSLEGNGSLTGNVTVQNGGTISPGQGADTIGTLTIGSVDLQAGSTSKSDIDGANSDQVRINGNVTIADGLVIPAGEIVNPPTQGLYVVANNLGANPIAGAFATLPQNPAGTPFVFDGRPAVIYYNYNAATNTFGTGNDIAINFNSAPTITVDATLVFANEGVGATVTNTGTFNDPDAGDIVNLTPSIGTVMKTGPSSWSWSAPAADGPLGPTRVTITATDSFGATATAEFDYRVDNVAPTVTASAPDKAVPGQTIFLDLSALDVPADAAAGFLYRIDWDGNLTIDETIPVSSNNGTQLVPHIYTALGSNTIRVTVRDKDGGETVVTHPISIEPVAEVDGVVYVGGTNGNDRITLQSGLGVRFNGKLLPNVPVSGKVVVFGNGGNDNITVTGSIGAAVEFYGGAGDDYLAGGNTDDTLDGGAGRDRLLGGNGNDVLLGGPGVDTLSGGAGNDYLGGALMLDLPDDPDTIIDSGDSASDTANGDAGDDVIIGGEGNDTLNGGTGNDYLSGNGGGDKLDGGDGPDILSGGNGPDTMYGRGGQDVLIGGASLDKLYGGAGADLMYAGDFPELTDADLLDLWMWSSGDPTIATDLIEANASDDGPADFLYGEGDIDTYMLYIIDKITTAGDAKTNTIIPLS